ncbi:MAG: hypothetical protein LQ338_005710 [Usnochroma carphineum]|nr:MAG: hypothetical protein LQ338_005710 [Usnochroma carphineum]
MAITDLKPLFSRNMKIIKKGGISVSRESLICRLRCHYGTTSLTDSHRDTTRLARTERQAGPFRSWTDAKTIFFVVRYSDDKEVRPVVPNEKHLDEAKRLYNLNFIESHCHEFQQMSAAVSPAMINGRHCRQRPAAFQWRNMLAEIPPHSADIFLLYGFDGMSCSFNRWRAFRDQWPLLHFHLIVRDTNRIRYDMDDDEWQQIKAHWRGAGKYYYGHFSASSLVDGDGQHSQPEYTHLLALWEVEYQKRVDIENIYTGKWLGKGRNMG